MNKIIKGYKFIKSNMKSENGNHTWEIGKWYKEEEIELCAKGFHACETPLQSLNYIYGDYWFEVEARGKILKENDKFVAQEMRLVKQIPVKRIIKRFALFCAKQCLKNYEKKYPDDKRVSDCIKANEDYLDGKITLQELYAAARSAESAARSAQSAAWSAAQSAAWSAESAARSAQSAARSAAQSAAWSAESAAQSAESAARSAQGKELNRLIKESKYIPEYINELEDYEIFIFGSNLSGIHGAGAAFQAKEKFGAIQGIGEGLTGQCYAFPTKDKNIETRNLKDIKESVNKLIECANSNPNKIFLLTKVGCGLAGYSELEIKPLFKKVPKNILKPKGW